MNKYEIIKDIGGGTFGTVYQGIKKENNEKVAIKKLKQKIDSWEDCMNQNEVYFLRKLVHPNIIKLIEVIREQNSDVSFIFEYCDCNLYEYITNHRKRKKAIPEDKIQNIIYNITSGLAYMHSQNVMHRDLKPENILISLNNINTNNSIKIADFGTAKEVPQYKNESLTEYICTRWYRAPECVLKSRNYDEKIDIWALGCIMAELYSLKPLFPGQNEFDQIDKIVRILGTPNYEEWSEGFRLMENLNMKFPEYTKKNFKNILFDISNEAIDFLEYIFQYDSNKRPSAKQLLNHPFLKSGINLNKIRINSYCNQTARNSSINNPVNYNYKIIDEKKRFNNTNNQVSSPTFFLPKIKTSNINSNNSRIDTEDSYYNVKAGGRSKSSMSEPRKNNFNKNNNIFNIIRDNNTRNNNFDISNFENENKNKELNEINKLLDNNIMKIQNRYDNSIYSNINNINNYNPYKKIYNTNENHEFSSIAKNEIIQNNPFSFNRFIEKQKEKILNEDKFHNIMPQIRGYSNNNKFNIFKMNNNNGINNTPDGGQYQSFFGKRYNL